MSQTAPLSPKCFGTDYPAHFASKGYLIVHDFMPPEHLEGLRASILEYSKHKPVIEVRWENSTFDTLNGAQVDDHFPELRDLYDQHLFGEVSRLHQGTLATVSDRRVGISINLTAPSGKFQPHYDRNVMTAILYVNDAYDGGEMMFYPRVRFWLGHPSTRIKHVLQRILDKIAGNRWYLRLLARKIVIKPKAGDLLVFEGTRTLHTVMPVRNGETRLTIQFAYDQPGIAFDVSDYYGK